jgi:ubiquinone/menaquinone biosynthesis C-methylase UbiE
MILIRFLRFVFKLLYHQLAWTYDLVAWLVSAGQWRTWVLSTVPLLGAAGQILEIGHGPGHLQRQLLQDGRRVTGVDLSPQMGRLAFRRLRRAALSPRLVRADALHLPFRSAGFDAVAATFPAEYIADPAAWQSFARVLVPGGRVVVLLGANVLGSGPLRLLSRLLFRLTRQEVREPEALIRARFAHALADAGLEIEFKQVGVNGSTVFYCLGKKLDLTTEHSENTEKNPSEKFDR